MSVSCGRIATLVTTMQSEFLNRPDLTLTLPQAQARLGADQITCQAVLGALVDARVLAKGASGSFLEDRLGQKLMSPPGRDDSGPLWRPPLADFAA